MIENLIRSVLRFVAGVTVAFPLIIFLGGLTTWMVLSWLEIGRALKRLEFRWLTVFSIPGVIFSIWFGINMLGAGVHAVATKLNPNDDPTNWIPIFLIGFSILFA